MEVQIDSFLKKFEKKKNLMNTAASTKDPNQHTNICPKLAMNTHLAINTD